MSLCMGNCACDDARSSLGAINLWLDCGIRERERVGGGGKGEKETKERERERGERE